jgi:hypothetical protein
MRDPIGRKRLAQDQILLILIQRLPSLDAMQADRHVCQSVVEEAIDPGLTMVRWGPFRAMHNAFVNLQGGQA